MQPPSQNTAKGAKFAKKTIKTNSKLTQNKLSRQRLLRSPLLDSGSPHHIRKGGRGLGSIVRWGDGYRNNNGGLGSTCIIYLHSPARCKYKFHENIYEII
ncbi:MAG: hypothetical protein Q8O41_02150 [Candidatus Methanoperedens sp.]|nr:hypothetical protein [Candidatus Methanoperedens sp.]